MYPIIETGDTLAFLYVTIPTDSMVGENLLYEWEEERLASDNSLIAYVYNLQNPSYSEFGYIGIDTFMDSGALTRIY